jgi:hypothetical protein
MTSTYYDDSLPAGWREYDDYAEYQGQVADDLGAELLASIPEEFIW